MVDITEQKPPIFTRQNHFDKDRMAGSVSIWGENTSNNMGKNSHILSATDNKGSQNTQVPPSFSFSEFLDIINPLQHIPVVNKLYQSLTGDTASSVSQIIGGTIYGGALGGSISIMNAAISEQQDTANLPEYKFVEEQRTAGFTKV
jgi:hypothetical protein